MKPTLRSRRHFARLWPLVAVLGLLVIAAAGRSPGTKPAGPSLLADKYIGAKKCENCHDAEASGNQWGAWEKGPHAQAFTTLATDAAKAIAAEKGIADPQQAPECLKCHTTAGFLAGVKTGAKYDQARGVGCESCHGAGSGYKSMSVMKDHDASVAAGLVVPTEETCTACHNEKSPTFKGFDFAEYSAKIAHPNPAAE